MVFKRAASLSDVTGLPQESLERSFIRKSGMQKVVKNNFLQTEA
jgi:hypothetical protein